MDSSPAPARPDGGVQTTHVREMAANVLLGRALHVLDAAGGILRNMVTPRPDEPMVDPNYVHRMYRDWISQGYPNAFYDPYNPAARDIYQAFFNLKNWKP